MREWSWLFELVGIIGPCALIVAGAALIFFAPAWARTQGEIDLYTPRRPPVH